MGEFDESAGPATNALEGEAKGTPTAAPPSLSSAVGGGHGDVQGEGGQSAKSSAQDAATMGDLFSHYAK